MHDQGMSGGRHDGMVVEVDLVALEEFGGDVIILDLSTHEAIVRHNQLRTSGRVTAWRCTARWSCTATPTTSPSHSSWF